MKTTGFIVAGALAFGLAAPLAAQDHTAEAPADAQATDEHATDATAAEAPEAAHDEATTDTHAAMPMMDVSAQTVVATVNGTEITLGQMIIARSQLPPQYQELPDDVLFNGVLDQLIQQQVLAETLGDDPMRVTIALENERRLLRAGEVVQSIVQSEVTDEAVRAAYDTIFADTEGGTEYNASHILVATVEEAETVLARLAAGEDFAAVAQEVSTDVGSGANGGALGWFSDGMMVAPFEAAVKELEVGGVSGPVETQFGFHILTLNDTREQAAPAFDDVREEIEGQVREEAIQNALTDLTAAADVTRLDEGSIDPALLIDLSLLRDGE